MLNPSRISRREFLKLVSVILPGTLVAASLPQVTGHAASLNDPVVLYHGNRDLSVVAMTFDDCYDLNLLEQWAVFLAGYPQVHVTFFPVGTALENAAVKMPDLWGNLIIKGGHEIGYHSYNHDMPSTLSVTAEGEDYQKWLEAATQAIGSQPSVHFARPPFGELSYSFLTMCSNFNLSAAMWTNSWGMADVYFEKEKLLVQAGDIILFHIRYQDLENAKVALPFFLSRGLNPVTMSELYSLGNRPPAKPPACRPNPKKFCPL